MKGARTVLMLGLLLVGAVSFAASVPPLLNYQGVLRNASGEMVPDGNYSVTFRVWDSETGGAALWQEGRLVTVQKGLFTVLLGSIVPIPDSLFARPDRWLGLEVGLDPEMTPRQQLVTVPFAWHSLSADKSDTASIARKVDTSGYSAYTDLLSEGRIGTGADQMAPGNHTHSGSSLKLQEDTSIVEATIPGGGSEITLKTVIIAPGQVSYFSHVYVMVDDWWGACTNANLQYRVYLNGLEFYSGDRNSMGASQHLIQLLLFKIADSSGTLWFARSAGPTNYETFRHIDLNAGVTLTLSAQALNAYSCQTRIESILIESD